MGNVKEASGNRISQRRGRTIASSASLSILYLLRLFIVAFLLGSHDLIAQSGGPGIQLSSPESSHGGAPLCNGMPVGYQTYPVPAAGVCLDSIKECVLKGGQASWQTKTFNTGFSRSCVPSAQVDACQPYTCVAGAGRCSPSGTPVKCDPSADGCTAYACDPQKPGTCIITEKKDPNQCVVTWQDQETPCGGATIYHKVVTISDPCCKYKVGYIEPTSRVSPACNPTPQCTDGVFEVEFTGSVNNGIVPVGNAWAMKTSTAKGKVTLAHQAGKRVVVAGAATLEGRATGSLGGWGYDAKLGVSWSGSGNPSATVQLRRAGGIYSDGEVRDVSIATREDSAGISIVTISGEARVRSTTDWHAWNNFSVTAQVECSPCELFVGEVKAEEIANTSEDFGIYAFDKVFPRVQEGAPSCLAQWRDKVSKMSINTVKDPDFWNKQKHYRDDYWALWFIDDMAKVRNGVFYNPAKDFSPVCSVPCTKANTPMTPKCWCNKEAEGWAYGKDWKDVPAKIECVKRAPVGVPGYVHWEGACIDTKIYLDSSCNVVSATELAGKKVCGGAKITFYPSSPISLLWNTSKPITAHGSVVNFPLDKSRSDSWYVWYGSEETPLLVFDPAHKGTVSSVEQLFGNWTFGGQRSAALSLDASTTPRPWRDGYAALETLDHNGDDEISGEELEPLALWFDRGADAVVGVGEVRRLSEVGVTRLFLSPRSQDEMSRNVHVRRGYMVVSHGTERIGETVDWYSQGARTQAQLIALQQFGGALSVNRGESSEAKRAGISSPSPAPVVIAASILHDPRINGAWYWKAKEDQGSSPRGMLLITARQDSSISGISVTEIPIRDPAGKVSVIEMMKPFAGTIISKTEEHYRITFQTLGGDPQDESASISEADVDLRRGVVSGKTTEPIGDDKKLTYRWEATR